MEAGHFVMIMESECYYNKINEYKKTIEPIIQKLKIECNVEKLPMFVTVAVENNEKETIYESHAIYASSDLKLTNNKIGRLLLLSNDFKTEPPEHIKECIRMLQDYIDQNGKKVEGVRLTNDRIEKMGHLVKDNDVIAIHQTNNESFDAYSDFYEFD